MNTMQIATSWQPSYTPRRLYIECKPPKERGPHRRAYEVFGQSKTAQKILAVIENNAGITCMDVIKETKLIGAGQYIKTMMIDGLIRVERHHLPHTKQRVNHYYWSAT